MFKKNWYLGILGFLGFFFIKAYSGDPLYLFFLLWFSWFVYFIPEQRKFTIFHIDFGGELEKEEIYKKLQITITIVIFLLVLFKTFMAAGFTVPETCSIYNVAKDAKSSPDLIYGSMSASVAAYVLLTWFFVWKRNSMRNSKLICYSDKVLTHNLILLGILIVYLSNISSLISSLCSNSIGLSQRMFIPLLLLMSKIFGPLLLLYSVVIPLIVFLLLAYSCQ